jgi:hypothetical protein
LDTEKVEHEFNTLMIITHGKYPKIASQMGSLKSMVPWIMDHLGMPHEFPLSHPPFSTTSAKELSS